MSKPSPFWAYLIHLGYNMWYERDAGFGRLSDGYAEDYCTASETLRFDRELWDLLVDQMAEAGVDTLVIDLGEGLRYESHPEIAVRGSLDKREFAAMLGNLRRRGITPIPKLNFSACHDEWLGPYARQVSSDVYYRVCNDLIDEACELFDKPELFHLGMDEETYAHQKRARYALIRNAGLWWHDLFHIAGAAQRNGARPWVWADRIWHHRDDFLTHMPREFLLSNWYYGSGFRDDNLYVGAFNLLDEHGYEDVPTGGNWNCQWNFEGTVRYCMDQCSPRRIPGFLQTVWRPTLMAVRYRHQEAVDMVGQARRAVLDGKWTWRSATLPVDQQGEQ